MAQPTIRGYRPADDAAILEVWNRGLIADPINVTTWRAKVLLDPNFDQEGCLIAEVDGEIRGFLLSLVRRVPFFNDGLEPDRSWMTAFTVDPAWQRQGIGTALLDAATERLRRLDRKTLEITSYVPNYFTPGVDIRAYATGVDFLTKRGFQRSRDQLSMRVELTGFQLPEAIVERIQKLQADHIEVRPVTPADIAPLLDFIPRHFSWDWHREATGVLNDLYNGDPRFVGMVIARQGEEVLGYAEHRGERFGPFGVRPDLRSRGIGRVLLATTLLEMLKKNYHAAWFMSTGEDAARLYAQLGFHEVRRFAAMKKEL